MAKRLCSLPDCAKDHYARGLCSVHYQRDRKYGDPLGGGPENGTALRWLQDMIDDLLENPTNECVLHPFPLGSGGYGSLVLNEKRIGLHRAALVLSGGTLTSRGSVARHLCGEPRCVNPRHLRVGTAQENADDREAHGRTAHGAKIPQFKISDDTVREIRASQETNKEVAVRLGLHPTTVGAIRNGKRRQRVE